MSHKTSAHSAVDTAGNHLLLELLSKPIAFHRVFVKIGGSVTAGLLLSQAFYWSKNKTAKARDGWFYKSAAEWEEETGLTRREQETARRHLREKGILEEEIRPLADGRVLWFRVNVEMLSGALKALVEAAEPAHDTSVKPTAGATEEPAESTGRGVAQKRQTPLHESARPVAQKRQTSLITTETTAETTAKTTHTHLRAAGAPAGAANAGVCVDGSKSHFSFEERKAHADKHGLGPGWLQNSRDGRYDELIADAIERSKPESVEAARTAPVDNRMSYGAALQHIGSVISCGGPGSDPIAEIERLFNDSKISEETRARLLTRNWQGNSSGRAA